MESYDKFSKIGGVVFVIVMALFMFAPQIKQKIASEKVQSYYSYYDAVGNKVIINLNKDGSGTIKMQYAKTSSGLEEYMSKEPVACSWSNYTGLGYLAIYSRSGDIYIKDGYAYFNTLDMEAKDPKRRCKLN